MSTELMKTIKLLVTPGKGILAADESNPTIAKRFNTIGVEATEENRRRYRELLFTTEGLGNHINGVILFDETIRQSSKDGVSFVDLLKKQNIVPGIKVDKGVIPLPESPQETITQGLDNLTERLAEYKALGAGFAKWRAVLNISEEFPTHYAIHANAEALARYASICQGQGIVPIVEPELLMEGSHTIERCAKATEMTLNAVFYALRQHRVKLEYMILKPNMVISGSDCSLQAGTQAVAEETVKVLRRSVPAAVPSINFLSGGQSDQAATDHLKAMNQLPIHHPWLLSFSYGRALQAPVLKAWAGDDQNTLKAQRCLLERAWENGRATLSSTNQTF